MDYHSNDFSSIISFQEHKLSNALQKCKQFFVLVRRISSVSTDILRMWICEVLHV
jgi:hypothetical protein